MKLKILINEIKSSVFGFNTVLDKLKGIVPTSGVYKGGSDVEYRGSSAISVIFSSLSSYINVFILLSFKLYIDDLCSVVYVH